MTGDDLRWKVEMWRSYFRRTRLALASSGRKLLQVDVGKEVILGRVNW